MHWLQADLIHFVWQHNLTHLEENSSMFKLPKPMLKSKGKTCMVKEPSHVKKQLSLNHMCKIGLNIITHLIVEEKRPGGADNYERTAS